MARSSLFGCSVAAMAALALAVGCGSDDEDGASGGGASGGTGGTGSGGAAGSSGTGGAAGSVGGSAGSSGAAGSAGSSGAGGSAGGAGLQIEVLDDDIPYPEGPLWIAGNLYYVGYGADQVRMWDGTTVAIVWEAAPGDPFTRCGPSSLIQRANGNLLITCYDTNLLQEITIDGAEVATYDTDVNGDPIVGPNDFAKDAQGGIYFSASGVFDLTAPVAGKVYYLDTSDVITDAAAGELFHYSNGLALKDDGDRLLVDEHLAKQITVLDVASPGVLENRQVFKKLSDIAPDPATPDPKMGPDGIKVSPSTGDIYICQYGASRILVTDGAGVLKHEIEMPYPFVTNVNFGASESTLFATVETDANNPDWVYSGKLYRVTTNW